VTRTGRVLLAGVLAASLTASVALTSGQAMADPDPPKPPVIPSQSEVDAARKAAGDKAGEVAAIENRLAAANTRLEALGVAAGRAAEAYNGALYRLQKAKAEAAAATVRAAKAQATVDQQGRQIGRLAAATYQGGGQIAQLGPLFTADGPQSLLDRAGTANSVSAAMQGAYLRYTASKVVANAFRLQADKALAQVRKATDEAAAAKRRAEAAVATQSAAVSSMGAERHQLIGQLAQLRKTSYQVAEQRQRGLEELARQKAAAEAKRKAEEQARRAAIRAAAEAAARAREAAAKAEKRKAAAARKAAERAERAARDAREARSRQAREEAARRAEEAAEEAERESNNRPQRPDPGRHGDVSAVIAFAMAQLGEPYVWAAAGPDSWDCSGLTMRAWRTAGVYLPHYSVAQYEQVRHISADELRPGDLIFWADDASDPGTIFHVALYIGDGRMIHAPRPGRPVTIDSVYYWENPDFFGRP
jgi:peptidoglycan DL-endopeptidase CwlO